MFLIILKPLPDKVDVLVFDGVGVENVTDQVDQHALCREPIGDSAFDE